jgi:hypothetical protein
MPIHKQNGKRMASLSLASVRLERVLCVRTRGMLMPRFRKTISHDEIALRAYELYVARGGEDGQDLDDWLRADQELSVARRNFPRTVCSVMCPPSAKSAVLV